MWNRRPGRRGSLCGFHQPDTLLVWNDYNTVHKTTAYKEGMAKSNTILLPGGLTPKVKPCDGLLTELFKSNMTSPDDKHMTSPGIKCDDRGFPEPPSRGLLAQWVKKAWTRTMARLSVQPGRMLAHFFPSTARETKRGPGRSRTRMPEETLGRGFR